MRNVSSPLLLVDQDLRGMASRTVGRRSMQTRAPRMPLENVIRALHGEMMVGMDQPTRAADRGLQADLSELLVAVSHR